MSRILRRKYVVFIMLILLIIVSLMYKCYVVAVGLCFIMSMTVTYCCMNIRVKKTIDKQVTPFDTYSEIRNVDYLIIGDMYKLPQNIKSADYVHIFAPNRTLYACFEILKHTHSILKKGGKVIFAIKKNNVDKKEYSLFDIPFFHYITIRLQNLEILKRKYSRPVINAFFESLLICANIFSKGYKIEKAPEDVALFCNERGYGIEMRIK